MNVPHRVPDRTATRDAVLRLALCAMAANRESALTPAQRQWIIALGARTMPLTTNERLKLKMPLLEWVSARQPRIYAIVASQFAFDDIRDTP